MIYKLTLGDQEKEHKDVLFDCNYPVDKIRDAYRKSCKSLGIQFNNNIDYTGLGISNGDSRMIWTEHQDNTICEQAYDILQNTNCLSGLDIRFDSYGSVLISYADAATLIMRFIALSMPDDFAYTRIEEDYESINDDDAGYNKFGYGLFDY